MFKRSSKVMFKRRRKLLPALLLLIFSLTGLIIAYQLVAKSPIFTTSRAAEGLTEYNNIIYGSAIAYTGGRVNLKMDIYVPKQATATNRLPVVIYLPGGSFKAAPRSWVQPSAMELAQSGYVTAAVEYRVRPEETVSYAAPDKALPVILDAQHDVQAAVRFLRANADKYNLDPNRVGVVGISAGAITALYVGYNYEDPGDSGNPGYSSRVQAVVSIAGAMIQPENYMASGDPPLLMFHGEKDGAVPFAMAEKTRDAAKNVGIPVKFISFPNQQHVIWNNKEIEPNTNNFLKQYLKDVSATPLPSPSPQPSPTGDNTKPTEENTPPNQNTAGQTHSVQKPGGKTQTENLLCSLTNGYLQAKGQLTEEELKQLDHLIAKYHNLSILAELGISSADDLMVYYQQNCIN